MLSKLAAGQAWRDDPVTHWAQPAENPGASRTSPSNSYEGCRAQPVSRYVESEKVPRTRQAWPEASYSPVTHQPFHLTRNSWGDSPNARAPVLGADPRSGAPGHQFARRRSVDPGLDLGSDGWARVSHP